MSVFGVRLMSGGMIPRGALRPRAAGSWKLAGRAPVGGSCVLPETLSQQARPAAKAGLFGAAVDPEDAATVVGGARDPGAAAEVVQEQAFRGPVERREGRVRNVPESSPRCTALEEEDLGFVDVADTAGDPLIQQQIDELGLGARECAGAIEQRFGGRCIAAQIRSEAVCPIASAQPVGIEDLDLFCVETDVVLPGDVQDERCPTRRLLPGLSDRVTVPGAIHPEVNAKRGPAFEVDEEMLALARHPQDVVLCERGDGATLQAGAVETLADQSAGQKGRELVDGVAFGHALNLHPADKKTPRDAGRAN